MLNKINITNILILLYTFILTNYFFLLIKVDFLTITNAYLFIITVVYFIFFIEKDFFIKIFFILIITISLGTLIDGWDSRSIWMLKTKIIFFEKDLISLNKIPDFAHPTYPNLAPAFCASFVKIIGHWNEFFPKIGITLMYIPPVIYLTNKFKKDYPYAILSLLLFVVGQFFFRAYIDGLVAIYALISLLIAYDFTNKFGEFNNFNLLILFLNNLTLSLLKNEGIIILVLLLTILFFSLSMNEKRNRKIIFVFLVSLVPAITWFIYAHYLSNLYHVSEANFSINSLYKRINNFENFIMILKYFFSQTKFIIGIIIFVLSILLLKNNKGNILIIYFNLVYLIVLILIYLSTNADLEWHLSSSVSRISKPMILSFYTFSLYNFFIYKNKIQ